MNYVDPTGNGFEYNPGNGGGWGPVYSYTPDPPPANNGGNGPYDYNNGAENPHAGEPATPLFPTTSGGGNGSNKNGDSNTGIGGGAIGGATGDDTEGTSGTTTEPPEKTYPLNKDAPVNIVISRGESGSDGVGNASTTSKGNNNPWPVVVADAKLAKNTASLLGNGCVWVERVYVGIAKDYAKAMNTGYIGKFGPYFESSTCVFVANAKEAFRKAYSFGRVGSPLANATSKLGAASVTVYVIMIIDVSATYYFSGAALGNYKLLKYGVSTAAGVLVGGAVTTALAGPTLGSGTFAGVAAGIGTSALVGTGFDVVYGIWLSKWF